MKVLFRLLFIFIISFLIHSAKAQILNIEKSRLEEDSTKKTMGNFEFRFNLQQQQVRVFNFSANNNLSFFSNKHQYIAIGNINLVSVSGEDVISNGYVHFRVNLFHHKKLSYELFTQAQYDDVRGMNHRYLGGGALRWKLRDTKKLTIALSTGVMFEDESWSFAEVDSATQLIKSTSYLSYHHQLFKNFELNLIGYYQARYDMFDKPRLIGDFNFNFKISEHFTIISKFLVLYDAAPIVPIDKLIYTFENGIQINF